MVVAPSRAASRARAARLSRTFWRRSAEISSTGDSSRDRPRRERSQARRSLRGRFRQRREVGRAPRCAALRRQSRGTRRNACRDPRSTPQRPHRFASRARRRRIAFGLWVESGRHSRAKRQRAQQKASRLPGSQRDGRGRGQPQRGRADRRQRGTNDNRQRGARLALRSCSSGAAHCAKGTRRGHVTCCCPAQFRVQGDARGPAEQRPLGGWRRRRSRRGRGLARATRRQQSVESVAKGSELASRQGKAVACRRPLLARKIFDPEVEERSSAVGPAPEPKATLARPTRGPNGFVGAHRAADRRRTPARVRSSRSETWAVASAARRGVFRTAVVARYTSRSARLQTSDRPARDSGSPRLPATRTAERLPKVARSSG